MELPVQVLPRQEHENNREYAYRVLHVNIMNFWLEPGAVLNEGELSATFHMSRTPVHEAIIKLRNEHLVDVQAQLGSAVSLIDLRLLREGYFIRASVGPSVFGDLAGKVEAPDVARLQEIINRQQALVNKPDTVMEFFAMDDEFHRAIYDIYGMPDVWDAIKSVSSHFDRVRFLDAAHWSSTPAYKANIVEAHSHILELLLCGPPPGFDVGGFCTSHISHYRKNLMRIIQRFPGYFSSVADTLQ